jgi:hypothetical protein
MNGIAQTVRRASSSVEDFRGDYERLAAMMRASWEHNEAPPFLYTPEFLADYFRYPGSSFSLAPTIYRGSEPIAFAVGYPRRVMIGGAERRILISTFLTVARERKSSGCGVVVWSELMRRAAQAGFDGVVNYCVEGAVMDRMIHGICRWLELPLLRAASFSYLHKSMWIPAAEAGEPGPYPSPADLCRAAAEMPRHADISRLWMEDEAAWQLTRLGAVSVRAGPDERPAVLTGYVTSVADAVHTRFLIIDDVLWGDLAARGRETLVRALLSKASAAGARVAILPLLRYADTRPFVASGFMHAQHTTHCYLTMWSDPLDGRPADRCYLDVI